MAARRALFPDGNLPLDTATRREQLNSVIDESDTDNVLADLDKKYWGNPDNLSERLRKYALDNHLVKIEPA
jgi:Domain of unknown function (DUF4375)